MKALKFARISLLATIFLSTAFAGDRYLVRLADGPQQSVWNLALKYGGTVAKTLKHSDGDALYLIELPAGNLAALKLDRDVVSVEADEKVKLPLRNFHQDSFRDTPAKVRGFKGSKRKISLFGTPAWYPYVSQPAANIIRIDEARRWATGAGVVAVIDTGADGTHPVLAAALTLGWDFTNDKPGAEEDLDQEVTPILDDQEVTPILDSGGTIILNQDFLEEEQEVTPILDSRIPPALGHGTMTAGLIHLVAPTARIMPLKAFRSDGTGSLANVIEAIYWAIDHGAAIISMSFDASSSSEELKKAIQYATARKVILVASAGNDGQNVVVYPAGYDSVIGVAATSNQDIRSSFSNYGAAVKLSAPGEAIVSTFPRNRYAMGWGTSFSAPMVSGAAALLLQLNGQLSPRAAWEALSAAAPIQSPGMGAGRLDLVQACIAAGNH